MISISSQYAESLGLSVEDVNASSHLTGVYACRMMAFGARGDGVRRHDDSLDRIEDLLRAEPEPRSLLLVGRSDNYGVGARLAAVTEIGVNLSEAAGGAPAERPLSAEESDRLSALVRAHAHDADLALRVLGIPGAAGALDYLGLAGAGCRSCGGVSGWQLRQIPSAYLAAVRALPRAPVPPEPRDACWTCRSLLAAGVDPSALELDTGRAEYDAGCERDDDPDEDRAP